MSKEIEEQLKEITNALEGLTLKVYPIGVTKPKQSKDVENWDDLPISEQKALLVRGCIDDGPQEVKNKHE